MPQSNQAAAIPAAETDDARAQARAKARAAAGSSGWLKLILDHHEQVEEAFESPKRQRSTPHWRWPA
jgi:hypothetical protein